MRQYRVTAPRPVLGVEPGGLVTADLDPASEADLLASGRLALVPAPYRVVGTSVVHGAHPGETVELALPLPQERALIEAGHIEPVEREREARKRKEE